MPLDLMSATDCGPARNLTRALAATRSFAAAANVCYVLATRVGLFGLAVVITSLYPGMSVPLARFVLGERMRWLQRTGLLLAAVGVVLVTASAPSRGSKKAAPARGGRKRTVRRSHDQRCTWSRAKWGMSDRVIPRSASSRSVSKESSRTVSPYSRQAWT